MDMVILFEVHNTKCSALQTEKNEVQEATAAFKDNEY